MMVPCPGDVLRFGVSSGAADQLSLLQTHEPVSCSSGDGGIWGVWHRNTDISMQWHWIFTHILHGKPCMSGLFISRDGHLKKFVHAINTPDEQRWEKVIVSVVTVSILKIQESWVFFIIYLVLTNKLWTFKSKLVRAVLVQHVISLT